MKSQTVLIALALMCLLAMAAQRAGAAPGDRGMTLSEVQAAGIEPLDGADLAELFVGNALLLRNYADGLTYEVVFLESGKIIRRPRGGLRDQGDLAEGPVARIADYTIEGNRLIARLGTEAETFVFYELDDAVVGYVEGEQAPRTRLSRRPSPRAAELTVRQLDARSILPISERALRELVVGNTLTLLQRSTGDYFTATFDENGTRTVIEGSTGERSTADYGIFNSNLVTKYGGTTLFVTVYNLGGVYLAANSADDGVIDWEILGVD